MPERTREVVAVPLFQEYLCDNCNIGTMRLDNNIAYMTTPTQYQHKCSHCGLVRTFTKQYPTITYRYEEIPVVPPAEDPLAGIPEIDASNLQIVEGSVNA